jgi:hypothetical protein
LQPRCDTRPKAPLQTLALSALIDLSSARFSALSQLRETPRVHWYNVACCFQARYFCLSSGGLNGEPGYRGFALAWRYFAAGTDRPLGLQSVMR